MKILKSLVILMVLIMSLSCGKSSIIGDSKNNCFGGAPQWVCAPNIEGGLAAVGSEKIGKKSINDATVLAKASARNDLARSIQLKINDMIKNFSESTGIGDSETVDRVATQVSKQVTSQFLNGAIHRDTWVYDEKDELFVFVVLETSNDFVKNAITDESVSSFKKEGALWQKFQADNAQKELEEEIEKYFGN